MALLQQMSLGRTLVLQLGVQSGLHQASKESPHCPVHLQKTGEGLLQYLTGLFSSCFKVKSTFTLKPAALRMSISVI